MKLERTRTRGTRSNNDSSVQDTVGEDVSRDWTTLLGHDLQNHYNHGANDRLRTTGTPYYTGVPEDTFY